MSIVQAKIPKCARRFRCKGFAIVTESLELTTEETRRYQTI